MTQRRELVAYLQRSNTSRKNERSILNGKLLPKQGGMILCADRPRNFVSKVSIEFVGPVEPLWNLDHLVKV